jgi:RimJ/RimL family protein N-acetyltransferase
LAVVRELQASDFQDITSYYYAFYDEVKHNPDLGVTLFNTKPSWAAELAWFAELYKGIEQGRNIAFVAEESGHVVGLCEVGRLQSDHEVSHRGELGISVKKEFRGKGIGSELLTRTLECCKGKFEIVELSVFTTNEVAKKLYRKYGFKSSGLRPRAVKRFGKYIDEEMMYLELSTMPPEESVTRQRRYESI